MSNLNSSHAASTSIAIPVSPSESSGKSATAENITSPVLTADGVPHAETVSHPETSHPKTLSVTVVIPTYNGAARLPSLLDALRSQVTPAHITWEIIVCDNNSTDDTYEVVEHYQANWIPQVRLIYRIEPRQGAAFARQRAVECARGELIAFLDDDNIPAANWIAEACKFAQQHPEAGGFGSQIHGRFESELPKDLVNIRSFLAIIERGDEPERYEPVKKMLPPAAGLVVRRQAWLDHVPTKLFLNNTSKSAGLASEDLEAILHIQKAGWEIWYNPDMVVHHDIPDGRLTKDYLVSLFRCVGLSCFHIRMLRVKKWDKPFAVPAHIANDIRKLALHRIRYGARNHLNTVDSCQRTLLSNAVKSPVFLLNKARKDILQAQADKRFGDRDAYMNRISQALEEDKFTLYQQPVVQLVKGTLNSSAASFSPIQKELLLRLRNDQNETVLAGDILMSARHYGIVSTIDRWVIRHLFKLAQSEERKLEHSYESAKSSDRLLYSINLSEQSAQDLSLVDFIARRLQQSKLPPDLFCFEIPATAALSKTSNAREVILALRRLGCQVTLDDAVVNRSLIALLSNLPINYLKINAATIPSTQSEGLSSQLNAISTQYSVQAIAKGIESALSLEHARQHGIYQAQGYQIAKPEPAI